eukprot:6436795-Alexandrium_andersonii.AAC.1
MNPLELTDVFHEDGDIPEVDANEAQKPTTTHEPSPPSEAEIRAHQLAHQLSTAGAGRWWARHIPSATRRSWIRLPWCRWIISTGRRAIPKTMFIPSSRSSLPTSPMAWPAWRRRRGP